MSDLLFEVTYIDMNGKTHQKTIVALNESVAMTRTVLVHYATKILKVEEIR